MANTMKITVENSDVLTHAVVNGIDALDIIASVSQGAEVTITQDCILAASLRSANTGDCYVKVNNVTILLLPNDGHQRSAIFYLKKGDILKIQGGYWAYWAYLFGVKR